REQLLRMAKTPHAARLRRFSHNRRRGAMKRSTGRILTTHAGRLPNPDNIAAIQQARADGNQATFDQLMQAGVADRVRKQIELRNDIHSDGEFWKARDEQYYDSRVTGVTMRPLQPGERPTILLHQQERPMPSFRDFYANH